MSKIVTVDGVRYREEDAPKPKKAAPKAEAKQVKPRNKARSTDDK